MKTWLEYFEYNRAHRREIPWASPPQFDSRMVRPLIRSLQRFQVGESGDGHHLRKQAARTGDENYIAAIDLFIKEEQEHARLMARILENLKAPLLDHHWSDACFILLRRCFGLHHELLVLLIPEMIAKRYFRALRDGTHDPVLQTVCAQIMEDEEGHVAFHADYLQNALAHLSLPGRVLLRAVWRLVFRLACLVVLVDHRGVLSAAGVSAGSFWWDCGLIFDEVAAAIFSLAPTPGIDRQSWHLQQRVEQWAHNVASEGSKITVSAF